MSEKTLEAALDRVLAGQRGFAPFNVDDPVRDFMATYFDRDDEYTRGTVVDFLERIADLPRRKRRALASHSPAGDTEGMR